MDSTEERALDSHSWILLSSPHQGEHTAFTPYPLLDFDWAVMEEHGIVRVYKKTYVSWGHTHSQIDSTLELLHAALYRAWSAAC